MLIKYLRKKSKIEGQKGEPIGIVVALDKNRIGWSLCNGKDKWNKELGIMIAIVRADCRVNWYGAFFDGMLYEKYSKGKELVNKIVAMRNLAEKYDFNRSKE